MWPFGYSRGCPPTPRKKYPETKSPPNTPPPPSSPSSRPMMTMTTSFGPNDQFWRGVTPTSNVFRNPNAPPIQPPQPVAPVGKVHPLPPNVGGAGGGGDYVKNSSHFGMPMPHPHPPIPINTEESLLYSVATLLEDINKRVLVQMRDGKCLIGHLRSVDQFANITLTQAVERIFVDKEYGDVYRGVVLVRGDNLVIVGEVDEERGMEPLREVPFTDILSRQKDLLDFAEGKERGRVEGFKLRGLHYTARASHHDEQLRNFLGEDQFY